MKFIKLNVVFADSGGRPPHTVAVLAEDIVKMSQEGELTDVFVKDPQTGIKQYSCRMSLDDVLNQLNAPPELPGGRYGPAFVPKVVVMIEKGEVQEIWGNHHLTEARVFSFDDPGKPDSAMQADWDEVRDQYPYELKILNR